MSPRSYRLKVACAAGIGLAVVGLACGIANALLPPPADCVRDIRNPYRFRDWANYVDGADKTDGAAVVALISNSQGYAGEYPSQRGYPARLERLLNERQPGGRSRWEVLNFSMDGATPMDYMALAARLRDIRPDWLLVVTGSADFRAENAEHGFAYARTDLPTLLTEWAVAARMPWTFWRRNGRVEDTLTAWMNRRMPLLRARDCLWSWLDVRFPGMQPAFYAPQTPYRFWELKGRAVTAPVRRARDPGGGEVDQALDERSRAMLADFLDQVAAVPAEHCLVLCAPLRKEPGDRDLAEGVAFFRDILAEEAAARDLPHEDWSDALPPKDYITTSHFHDRNHRRMAAKLADRIAAEMEK